MNTQPASQPKPAMANGLPVTRDLRLAYGLSLVIALLVAVAAVAGLLFGASLYIVEERFLMRAPTDLFTLVVGLPLLLVSMWLARRGRLVGLLCWPAVLLYMLYIYLVYAIEGPLSFLFLLFVALVPLCAWTSISLASGIDVEKVGRRLAGKVPDRVAGGILLAFALLFVLMTVNRMLPALGNPSPQHLLEYSTWVADTAVSLPLWLIGGWLLWQRRPWGHVAGVGVLLYASMMFIGLVFILPFQALYGGAPIPWLDIGFMLVVGLICFVPLALFVRGIARSERVFSDETSQEVQPPVA